MFLVVHMVHCDCVIMVISVFPVPFAGSSAGKGSQG